MPTNQYPRTIAIGDDEILTFLGRRTDEQGEYLEVTNSVAPGKGPMMHTHLRQEEGLTVTQGRIGYQIDGEEEQFAGVGETVVFKPGTSHRFWNAGEDRLECTGYVRPPENFEYFLTEIYDSINRNGGERPDTAESAWLLHRYRTEFTMDAIPGFVQKTIFPITRLIGRLTGKFKRYEGAPEACG